MDRKNDTTKTKLIRVFEKKKILLEYLFIILLMILFYFLISVFLL